jgi:hypothetical protein
MSVMPVTNRFFFGLGPCKTVHKSGNSLCLSSSNHGATPVKTAPKSNTQPPEFQVVNMQLIAHARKATKKAAINTSV